MEDAARLDDSGEGTLERPGIRVGVMGGQQPKPPPRLDSYRIMQRGSGTGSRSASGSEIYERLPADTGSLGELFGTLLFMGSLNIINFLVSYSQTCFLKDSLNLRPKSPNHLFMKKNRVKIRAFCFIETWD